MKSAHGTKAELTLLSKDAAECLCEVGVGGVKEDKMSLRTRLVFVSRGRTWEIPAQ